MTVDESTPTTEHRSAQFEVDWSDANNSPSAIVNQFATGLSIPLRDGSPEGVYLVMGQLDTPVFIGSEEAVRRQIEANGGLLSVRVHGRYFLTPQRLDELIELLQAAKLNSNPRQAPPMTRNPSPQPASSNSLADRIRAASAAAAVSAAIPLGFLGSAQSVPVTRAEVTSRTVRVAYGSQPITRQSEVFDVSDEEYAAGVESTLQALGYTREQLRQWAAQQDFPDAVALMAWHLIQDDAPES